MTKMDGLVKSRKCQFVVIPAHAGIQSFLILMDSRFHGNDRKRTFYEVIKIKSIKTVSSTLKRR